MINRILLILKTQNLSSSQFADEIGVQRSSISHILSGRNNPSLEFVTKILKRFPDINSDWIIFGKGSMYKGSDSKIEEQNKNIKKINLQPDLFNADEPDQVEIQPLKVDDLVDTMFYDNLKEEKKDETDDIVPEIQSITKEITPQKKEEKENEIKDIEKAKPGSKNIDRIVIFFTDKSFKEYISE